LSVTRGRPGIVAASTHPGEEEILIEVHRTLAGFFPSLLTVIVPRHPDRGEAIAAHAVHADSDERTDIIRFLPRARRSPHRRAALPGLADGRADAPTACGR